MQVERERWTEHWEKDTFASERCYKVAFAKAQRARKHRRKEKHERTAPMIGNRNVESDSL